MPPSASQRIIAPLFSAKQQNSMHHWMQEPLQRVRVVDGPVGSPMQAQVQSSVVSEEPEVSEDTGLASESANSDTTPATAVAESSSKPEPEPEPESIVTRTACHLAYNTTSPGNLPAFYDSSIRFTELSVYIHGLMSQPGDVNVLGEINDGRTA